MKLWAVVEEKEDRVAICRLAGMENDCVGPWHMLCIFQSKKAAKRAQDKFNQNGFPNATMIPVRVTPDE